MVWLALATLTQREDEADLGRKIYDNRAIVDFLDSLNLPKGECLSLLDRALMRVALTAAVTSLEPSAVAQSIDEAFAEGATPTQVQEVVSLVAGLGVHSLMRTAPTILAAAVAAGYDLESPLAEYEQELWDRRVGTDNFWDAMERELPGFLKAMLRLSPAQFEAFFDFCAVPWKEPSVSARLKELIALSSDATPYHWFEPGFRLHARNAAKLGAGRRAIDESLALATAAPPPLGII